MTWYEWMERAVAWCKEKIKSEDTQLKTLTEKVSKMSDILDTLKADFEAYKQLVDASLTALQTKIADLTAGQLDPAKAAAIDAEINAAKAALNPAQ